jgi:AcrR family transcriptional regulator
MTSWAQTRRDHRAGQADAIAGAALTLLLDRGVSALTMAAIADAAGISRQTLYRYFPDLDAVLVGVANVIAAHDDDLAARLHALPGPVERLDALVRIVAGSHDASGLVALRSTLPPPARDVLAQHEDRMVCTVADVLADGIAAEVFRPDLDPAADAALVLGLAAAATTLTVERAIALVHRMVDPTPQENVP